MTRAAAPSHLDALTGLRGIAALGVVFYHVRLSLHDIVPDQAIAAMAKGYLAVDLFFMLSGFVIWYNYAERIADGGRAATKAFLWRRFARVWPLHGAILAAFAAFAAALAASGRDLAGYPFAELPLHILLIQNWGLTSQLTWNHPAWSISTELAAYLIFPALAVAGQWRQLPTVVLLGVAAILAAALHGLFALHGEATLGGDIPRLGLLRCLAEFVMGCLLCQVWSRWREVPGAALASAAACAAILAFSALAAVPETAFVPAAFFAGLLALAIGKGPLARGLGSRPLRYLGEISYSIYLSHFLLFILFKIAFVDRTVQIGWASLAGYLGLVLAVSAALFHGLERPAQRWLNARQPSRTAPSPNAPAE